MILLEIFAFLIVVYLAYQVGKHDRRAETEVWKERYSLLKERLK